MDDHLPALDHKHDHLKEVAAAIWTDGEPAVGIFSCVLGGDGMFDGVGHVLVATQSRLAEERISTAQLAYYEKRLCGPCRRQSTRPCQLELAPRVRTSSGTVADLLRPAADGASRENPARIPRTVRAGE